MWGVSQVIQGKECILPNNYEEKNGYNAPRTVAGDLMFCAYLSLTCRPRTNARGWYDYHQNLASRLSQLWVPASSGSEQIQRGYHPGLQAIAQSVSATAAKFVIGNAWALFHSHSRPHKFPYQFLLVKGRRPWLAVKTPPSHKSLFEVSYLVQKTMLLCAQECCQTRVSACWR